MANKKYVTLYKYLPFSDDADECKFTFCVFKNNELFFAPREKLNDPFEFLNENNDPLINVRAVSLTNSNQNKLMWSHYANGHRGICIAIKVLEKYVCPIIYIKKNSKIDLSKIKNKPGVKKNVNFKVFNNDLDYSVQKDRKWSYEKEYRIVLDIKNATNDNSVTKRDELYFFNRFKIIRIYYGVGFDFDNPNAKELEKILKKYPKIEKKKMKMAKDNYAVVPIDYEG